MITASDIDRIVLEALPYSWGDPARLAAWADELVWAHRTYPGGWTLEIGVGKGGTSLLFARTLELLYPNPKTRPLLVTIDPHGGRPYGAKGERLYGDAEAVVFKSVMARFPRHVHLPLSSEDVARSSLYMWDRGQDVQVSGEARWALVLIDGDHRADQILAEVEEYLPSVYGSMIVDNTDEDGATHERLRRVAPFEFFDGALAGAGPTGRQQWARWRRGHASTV